MPQESPVAAITGGSDGIGLATARRLAAAGYRVAICGRDPEKLKLAQAALGSNFLARQADVTDAMQLGRWIDEVAAAWRRIDVLVNSAGCAAKGSLLDVPAAESERMIRTNIEAVYQAVRLVWPIMGRQGGGVIVNLSSLAADKPHPGMGLYGASKAWVNVFTQALAAEGTPLGIRIYAVSPAATETRLLRQLFPQMPPGLMLRPEQVAEDIVALCDPTCGVASGQVVLIARS